MTPIEKLYALLESNGIYDEAISLLKEHRDNDSQYERKSKPYAVLDGNAITVDDLPSDVDVRWGPGLKKKLVALVRAGLFSFEEAEKRYAISREELSGWIRKYEEHGPKGLHSMKTQQLR